MSCGLGSLVSSLLAGLVGRRAGPRMDPPGGDPAAGEDVFIKCSGCHQAGEGAENSIGPQLNGVIGRKAARCRTMIIPTP